jgi:flagellar biosynthesis protein FlgN
MSVHPADIRQHLARVLDDESRHLAELEQLLIREAAVVNGDDAAAIEHIGDVRRSCLEQLTRLDAERLAPGRMLSFGDGRDGFARLLAWCDSDQKLRARWEQNLAIARRCKDLNDRNGAVVALKLSQVRQALATLRGGGTLPVYGRQGGTVSRFARRELGLA